MKHKEMVPLMGSIVVVEKMMVRERNGDERSWVEQSCSKRAGWVTGFRILQNGSMCQDDYGGTDEIYFQPNKSIKCMLVSFWPTMKPVRVPLDGFRVDWVTRPQPPSYTWTEQERSDLREEMESAPRDAKGRWTYCLP